MVEPFVLADQFVWGSPEFVSGLFFEAAEGRDMVLVGALFSFEKGGERYGKMEYY